MGGRMGMGEKGREVERNGKEEQRRYGILIHKNMAIQQKHTPHPCIVNVLLSHNPLVGLISITIPTPHLFYTCALRTLSLHDH